MCDHTPADAAVGTAATTIAELLADAPKNWGKWGSDDEVGALNYLTSATVLAAAAEIRQGKVFTLQVRMGDPAGEPVFAGRTASQRFMVLDKSHYLSSKTPQIPGGQEYADDYISFYLQGSTQYDALGHMWYDDQLWNGYDALSTVGGLAKASSLPIAERGIVGRGVLLDIARFRGKARLDRGELFDHDDLLACAAAQGVELRPRDIPIIRTGWLAYFYEAGPEEFYRDWSEPGMTYSPELVAWFDEMEIPNFVTDTIANEATFDPVSGVGVPLHAALLRNLGISFTEVAWLEELAADCAQDGQYAFLYTAGPLKVVGSAGTPVNPVVIK
ncbi:MAG: hypothetical protein V7607_1682 [Solirubrobacteraceae bacterium]